MATVGSLNVALGADAGPFNKALKDAQSGIDRFVKAANGVRLATVGIQAAFVAMAGGAVAAAYAMKKVADSADEMTKAAQKVGFLTEELSALKYTADLSGVGFESLQTSLVRLSRSMSDVAKGGESDAAKAFQVLGIAVTNADGSLRSASDVMSDVANKFAEFKDGAEKTALAVAIFGRAGADMIPLLNQGADAIRRSNEEAKEFGVTMSSDLGRASEQLNDNLSRVSYAMHGIYVQIAERVMPQLAELSDQFVALIKELKLAESAGQLAEKALGGLAYYAALAKGNFEGLAVSVAGWKDAMSTAFSGDIGGALTKLGTLRDTLADIEKRMLSSMQRISLINSGMLNGSQAILSDQGFTGGKPSPKPSAPTLASASSGGGASTPESAYDAEKARIEGRLTAIREGFLTEEELKRENYEKDLQLTDEALQKKIILEEDAAALILGIQKKYYDDLAKLKAAEDSTALKNAASFFSNMGKVTESWGKKNNAVAKGLALASALISTYEAANKAMAASATMGPAAAIASYAAVMAKGLAAVAAITSVNPSNGSGGGRSVGGGSSAGGGVSQLAAADQANKSMYVTLQGDIFNREMVRGLLEQISAFQKDGGGKVIFG